MMYSNGAGIIALYQAAAWRVVFGRGESHPGIVLKIKYGLHQAFSEACFSHNQGARHDPAKAPATISEALALWRLITRR
jgi:hypothetical protein